MADSDANERLTKIESNLAELERLCDELNKIVIAQGKALHRMGARQQQISDTVETIEMDRIKSTNAKPPHYGP